MRRLRDLFTSAGRGARTFRAALSALGVRGAQIVLMLVSVPLVLHSLGVERYGLWTAALGLASLLANADGGVSNGLLSPVARAHGAHDVDEVRRLSAAGMAAGLTVAIPVLAAFTLCAFAVDWNWFFKLADPGAGRDVAYVIAILGGCYAIGFPPAIVRTVRLGLLHGPSVHAWDAFGTAATLVGLVAAVWLGAGLPGVALAWGLPGILARTLSALAFYAGEGRRYMPRRGDFDIALARRLILNGGAFLVAVLSQLVAQQADQLMIGRILGAAAIADYAVPLRLFSQAQVLAIVVLAAQWPAYAHALGQGDHAWIRRHLRMTLLGATAVAALFCAALALTIEPALKLWLRADMRPEPLLVAGLAAMGVAATLGSVFVYFYFALGLNARVAWSHLAALAINLALLALLLPKMGVAGAAIAGTASLTIALVVPGFVTLPPLLRRIDAAKRG